MEETKKKRFVITVDIELIEILDRLRDKVNILTWNGIEKLSYKDLTKILAKKINAAKLV